MAIAGGGMPAQRVSIYRRTLRYSGSCVNAADSVVWQPEHAAAHFIDNPKAFIYVAVTEGGGLSMLHALLVELDLINGIEAKE